MTTRTTLWIVAALTLCGLALRLYQINTPSLRGDEAFTVIHWMREPLAHTLANIATVDPQPPLAYALFRAWALMVGDGELVARLLPALLNTLGIPILYALGKRIGGRRLGLLTALLWTIHPLQIWHAQDARNYAIWGAFTPLALWLGLRALERRRRVDWLLYLIGAALAAYVYYLELFVIAALNLYVFITYWRQRRLIVTWTAVQAVLAGVLALWFLQERLLFGSGYGGTTGNTDPLQLLTWFLPELTFGESRPALLDPLLIVGIPVLLIGGTWIIRKDQRAVLFVFLVVLPLVFLSLVASRLNVFTPRYVLSVAVPITLLIGIVIHWLFTQRHLRIVGTILFLGVVSVTSFSLFNHYFMSDYAKSPRWRELAQYLASNITPNDWVTQAAADEAFTFYCREYQVSDRCDDKLPANPEQATSEIESFLTMRSTSADSLWYVANAPTDWINANVALDWLNANMQLGRSAQIGTLPARQFSTWEVEALSTEATTDFPQVARLHFADDLFRDAPDTLTIWLYWQPLEQTTAPLKIFVHLLTADRQLSAQDDQFPQDGRIDSLNWEVGAFYRDVYTLSLDNIQPGSYTLITGLYNPDTGERFLTDDGADHAVITTIMLP